LGRVLPPAWLQRSSRPQNVSCAGSVSPARRGAPASFDWPLGSVRKAEAGPKMSAPRNENQEETLPNHCSVGCHRNSAESSALAVWGRCRKTRPGEQPDQYRRLALRQGRPSRAAGNSSHGRSPHEYPMKDRHRRVAEKKSWTWPSTRSGDKMLETPAHQGPAPFGLSARLREILQ